jgi:hypothetical protein
MLFGIKRSLVSPHALCAPTFDRDCSSIVLDRAVQPVIALIRLSKIDCSRRLGGPFVPDLRLICVNLRLTLLRLVFKFQVLNVAQRQLQVIPQY